MECFVSYEKFEKYIESVAEKEIDHKILLLQYRILFRSIVEEDYEEFSKIQNQKVKKPVEENGVLKWQETNFCIKDIIEWNYGYLNKKTELDEEYSPDNELGYYTDLIEKAESVGDIFFLGEQPVLDIKYYEAQTLAAEHLNKTDSLNFQLIFDEVGTGKTVSAIYCMRDVLSEKKEKSKILIISPNNKKIEWAKDIQRQLGLYTHIVENNENKDFYKNDFKKVYFKSNEPAIFIEAQKKGEKNENLDKWSNENLEKWDLIIIDEGHQCFENYNNLSSNKAILLSATPIVANARKQNGIILISEKRTINEYIQLLCNIVGDSTTYELSNLFNQNELFTQIFREDLDINPKKRNITFLKCERWDERGSHLDMLADVKGGMTKLIYEQDDEFLFHGIYEKFKNDIEKNGYSLSSNKLEIKNNKYKKLVEYLNEKENKSYIIFFNCIWPAKNIYERLIKDNNFKKQDLIIGRKFGNKECELYPRNNAISPENILDYLQKEINCGKRVIFITTGATGGTGLNLGEFDGVINYELPFTSIELEQRFGRVDRMDKDDTNDKDMVFMINDNDLNDMLHYSTLKINETCKYMPIRNTILFYPEYIELVIKDLKKVLELCKFDEFTNFIYQISEMRKEIDDKDQILLTKLEEHIIKKGNIENFNEDIGQVSERSNNYIDNVVKNIDKILEIYYRNRLIDTLEVLIISWCNLLEIDEKSVDESMVNSVIIVNEEESEEESEAKIQNNNIVISNGVKVEEQEDKKKEFNLNFDIEKMIEKWTRLNKLVNKLENNSVSQTATGVVYIEDGKYKRKTVDEYRKTNKGEK